ncbi:hypothetical protein [Fusobacterium ulcerans]|uniref:hypothetical protein n=1 Tax=Fusobacterium ulcerans TaxID=861 RepID=UPI00103298D9|nr:hypothetical protein [Fusobacterium ulcerans]
MFVIFSFSYSGNTAFDVSVRGIYTKEDVIKNQTQIVNFEISEVTIRAKNNTKDTFFQVTNIETTNENFINGQNLKITNINKGIGNENRVYFKDNENNSIDTIKFSLKGTLIFNWKETNKKPDLAIGYRGEEHQYKNTSNYITVDLSDVKPITLLKISVKEDLNLGKGIAGSVLDTSNGSGSPATVEATGEYGKNVKFKILNPENIKITSIKNSQDSLKVDVWFENSNMSKTIIKKLNENTNETYTGKTSDIKIHGRCQSNSNSRGIYKGSFIVRVEYDD